MAGKTIDQRIKELQDRKAKVDQRALLKKTIDDAKKKLASLRK